MKKVITLKGIFKEDRKKKDNLVEISPGIMAPDDRTVNFVEVDYKGDIIKRHGIYLE